jgi:hypothetical protein
LENHPLEDHEEGQRITWKWVSGKEGFEDETWVEFA